MPDHVDDDIRQLVAEIVDAAPVAVQAPIAAASGRRRLALALLVVAGLVVAAGVALQPRSRAIQVDVGTGEAGDPPPASTDSAAGRTSHLAIFQRPRVPSDELSDTVSMAVGRAVNADAPSGADLDLDASRRGATAGQYTVWVIPSIDQQRVCVYLEIAAGGAAATCADLTRDPPIPGVSVGFRASDPPAVVGGVFLSDQVESVVDATVVDGTFLVVDDEVDSMDFERDGMAVVYVYRDGTTGTESEGVSAARSACGTVAEELLGSSDADLGVLSRLSESLAQTRSRAWIAAGELVVEAAGSSAAQAASSWEGWVAASDLVELCGLLGSIGELGHPDLRVGVAGGEPPPLADSELDRPRRTALVPPSLVEAIQVVVTDSSPFTRCETYEVQGKRWENLTGSACATSAPIALARTELPGEDYLHIVRVPDDTAYVEYEEGSRTVAHIPARGLFVAIASEVDIEIEPFDADGVSLG